jgi:hypothetical protein
MLGDGPSEPVAERLAALLSDLLRDLVEAFGDGAAQAVDLLLRERCGLNQVPVGHSGVVSGDQHGAFTAAHLRQALLKVLAVQQRLIVESPPHLVEQAVGLSGRPQVTD